MPYCNVQRVDSPITGRSPDRKTGTTTLWLLGLVIVFFAAFFPVWKGLTAAWWEAEEYSHGFVVLPICLYIVWRKRTSLRQIPIGPSYWGLVLTVLSLLSYALAYHAGIAPVARFSMILAAVGMIIYLFGFAVARALAFPFAMLLFMVPVPSLIYASLTSPLQLLVTRISVWIVGMFDVPVLREGNIIHLPSKTFQVVDACSGLRSMVSLSLLAALVGYFTLRSKPLRIILFLFATPVAISVNVVRITFVTLAFYFFNIDLLTPVCHRYFAYIIFLGAFVLIFSIRGILARWERSAGPE